MMSILDTCSSYNQIWMDGSDRIHTVFIIEWGLFCYRAMPFCLKNFKRNLVEANEQDVSEATWKDG